MHHLDDAEYFLIERYVQTAVAEAAAMGLVVRIDDDLRAWKALLQSAPGRSEVNPTFDPAYSLVGPENAFWLGLEDETGAVVACECLRLFQTEDFVSLIRSNRIFGDRRPALAHHRLDLVLPDDMPTIAGRVSHGGGLWVHPDWRGRKLAALVPRLLRALGLRHFELDWHTGLIRDTPNRRAMAAESYGFEHRVSCTRGFWPAYGRDLDIVLVYNDRREILELIGRDVAELRQFEPA